MRRIFLFPLQIVKFILFLLYYWKEFLKSNGILMIDILRPKSKITPAIVKFDLQSKTETEITLISSLISLTPGTLTLSIKADPPSLFVHGMFVKDVESFRESLVLLEYRMLKAMRYSEIETGEDKQK